jgi:hypothetical protein
LFELLEENSTFSIQIIDGSIVRIRGSGVGNSLTPKEIELNSDVAFIIVVAVGELVRGGQVKPIEDTIVESLESFKETIALTSIAEDLLENRSISSTGLLVLLVIEGVVNGSEGKIPIWEMSLIVNVFKELNVGHVGSVDSNLIKEILVILRVFDTLESTIDCGIEWDNLSRIDGNSSAVSSNEGTSEKVIKSLNLEISLSGDFSIAIVSS